MSFVVRSQRPLCDLAKGIGGKYCYGGNFPLFIHHHHHHHFPPHPKKKEETGNSSFPPSITSIHTQPAGYGKSELTVEKKRRALSEGAERRELLTDYSASATQVAASSERVVVPHFSLLFKGKTGQKPDNSQGKWWEKGPLGWSPQKKIEPMNTPYLVGIYWVYTYEQCYLFQGGWEMAYLPTWKSYSQSQNVGKYTVPFPMDPSWVRFPIFHPSLRK